MSLNKEQHTSLFDSKDISRSKDAFIILDYKTYNQTFRLQISDIDIWIFHLIFIYPPKKGNSRHHCFCQ